MNHKTIAMLVVGIAFNAKAPGIGTFDLVVQTLIAERDRRIVPAGHGVMTHG